MANLSSIIKELIAERDRLNSAIESLQGVSTGDSRSVRRSTRRLSAAARAKIAAAQRARWAKWKKSKRAA